MIKQVLVYTYGNRSHKGAIKAAAGFAKQYDAELMGLFVKPDVLGYSAVYGHFPLNLAEAYYDIQKDFEASSKTEFEQVVADYQIKSQWHQTEEFEKKPKPAFYADVIFVSQPDIESSVIFNDTDFVDHLITDTGLPTAVIPKDWSSDSFASSPVLAWKETREAVAAVRATLPLMQAASDVDIVTITKSTELDAELIEGIEISNYLNKHKIQTKFFAERMTKHDAKEADVLLRHVNHRDRDLIIMGGYSHSRFREIILGGLTRALIKHSTVPLLLAH